MIVWLFRRRGLGPDEHAVQVGSSIGILSPEIDDAISHVLFILCGQSMVRLR